MQKKKKIAQKPKKEEAREVPNKNVQPPQSLTMKAVDNRTAPRGFMWHVVFSLIFICSVTLLIYWKDWFLLGFIVMIALVIIWRGNKEIKLDLEVNDVALVVNKKEYLFRDIESFYFSKAGADATVSFQMIKKYYPRFTYILLEHDKIDDFRRRLQEKIPETEPREESYFDILARKLKL